MKIYYSHAMSIYGTKQEMRDMETLKKLFPDAEIYNPATDINADEGYRAIGMNYFKKIVTSCDVLAFRGVPYSGITAGVMQEIEWANEVYMLIIELPSFVGRAMSVDDTRNYLKEVGAR